MPKEALAAGSVDPLSGLSGLSLFPRTIRASADAPVPAAPKDLDSIHNIMKSLKELRSPEKLMSEAKKIVDGGANILSNFSSFAGNVSVTNDFAAKAKDKPQERRPGLGIARKKASFSLKTSISHPSVNLEPALDIDQLQDPDSFFDAFEKAENARKEIQKQLGVNKENIDFYKPPNNERRRRQGILGKSYNSKHRYSSTASENDDMWMSSQETVYQDIPSPPKDESQEKLKIPDPNIDADLEEVELAESTKTESQVNDMLEELLSCNYEDLEEQGALNLLQERLNIKTLDMDNLRCLTDRPDVGRANVLISPGSWKKSRKSSAVLDSALKVLNKKPRMEQELVENPVNPVSSPTPPRSPFGSLILLKRKILKPNPLTDPYSPQDIDLCAHPNLSSAQTKDKLHGHDATPKDLSMCNEMESHVEFGYTAPALDDIDAHDVMEKAKTPEQSGSESASRQRESGSSRVDVSPPHPKDKPVGHVATPKDLGMCNELESNVELGHTETSLSDMDSQEVMGKAGKTPEQSISKTPSMQRESGSSRENASPAQPRDKLIGHADAPNDLGMFNEMESTVELDSTTSPFCNLDTGETIENADGVPEQLEDENARIPSMDPSTRQNEESDHIGDTMNTDRSKNSYNDVGQANILISPGSWKKSRKSSAVLDSALKVLNKKPRMEQELVENPVNPVSSPTSPRNPFGSISLLKRKILKPNPLTDPYSPQDIDLCAHPNLSSAQTKDKLHGHDATPKDLSMCNEMESHVEFGYTAPALDDIDAHDVMEKAKTPEQSGSESASRQRESGSSRVDVSPPHPKDKPVGHVATPKDLGMCNELESNVELGHTETSLSDVDSQEVMGKAGKTPEQSRSKTPSMQRESGSSRENAFPAQPRDKLIGHADAPKDLGMFNEMESTVELDSTTSPFCNLDTGETIENADGVPEQLEDENARIPSMDTSTRQNEESDHIGDTMNTNRNESSPSVVDEEARDDTSTRRQINPEQQPKVQAAKRQSRKRVAGERIRAAHPMRKSLAEAGTSLETGVRRSKRVKMRPLEYWKGERFLYGRVEDSLKLIGVKYFSPGKSNENLKVKPYIMSEKPEYKEVLDFAARH